MKHLFLAAALVWATATTSFATDAPVTPAVQQTFSAEFQTAENVKWSVVDHLYKAEFTEDGEPRAAYFSMIDGSLVASCRYLATTELPKALQRSLKADATIDLVVEVFEVESDSATDYYATVKTGNETTVLKADGAKWSPYKKN